MGHSQTQRARVATYHFSCYPMTTEKPTDDHVRGVLPWRAWQQPQRGRQVHAERAHRNKWWWLADQQAALIHTLGAYVLAHARWVTR